MVTNLCFGLACLLIPLLIELFNLQAGLHISYAGHTLVEVLILFGMYWLFMQILRLDKRLYLQNYIQHNAISKSESRKAKSEDSIQPTVPVERPQSRQHKAAAFHWPRLPFDNVLKNHRTVKP